VFSPCIYPSTVSHPPLAALNKLESISFYRNSNLSDLKPIAGLSNINFLDNQYNNISDLSPLSNLENLEELYLSVNEISEFSPLHELDNLRILRLIDTPVTQSQKTLLETALPSTIIQ